MALWGTAGISSVELTILTLPDSRLSFKKNHYKKLIKTKITNIGEASCVIEVASEQKPMSLTKLYKEKKKLSNQWEINGEKVKILFMLK